MTARCAVYMGAMEIFESPRQFLPKFLIGFCSDRSCKNLKFVDLPIPEIIGGTQKFFGSPWIRPCSFFSQICNELMYRPHLQSVALPVSEIIAIGVFGLGLRIPILGKGRPQRVDDSMFERALVISYRPSMVIFPLSLRVSEILRFCAPARHLAFGLRRAKMLG